MNTCTTIKMKKHRDGCPSLEIRPKKTFRYFYPADKTCEFCESDGSSVDGTIGFLELEIQEHKCGLNEMKLCQKNNRNNTDFHKKERDGQSLCDFQLSIMELAKKAIKNKTAKLSRLKMQANNI